MSDCQNSFMRRVHCIMQFLTTIHEAGCYLFWKELAACRTIRKDRKLSCNPGRWEVRLKYCSYNCSRFVLDQHTISKQVPIAQ